MNTAREAAELLDENLSLVLKGKRDLNIGTFVQKSVSTRMQLVKTEVLEKLRVGDRTPIMWLFEDSSKKISNG